MNLPQNLNLENGHMSSDGTVVYQATDASVDAAVQALTDGKVRVQTVIRNPDATHEFSYEFGTNFQPVKAEDGTVWIIGFSDDGEYQAFSVDEAWAKDANGSDVPTRYEISGSNLIQIVEPHENAVYPLVADPTWQWYNAAYGAGFSKKETKALNAAGPGAGLCGVLPQPLSAACAAVAVPWALQASLAAGANQCVFIAVVPAPIAMRWISKECK
ncbi:hypothetical protein [Lysinibacter sp. HNR]|uniref:hypothetical protein n=1 Tax=Lysinibacter sp. HNR TaxID=3031408 RepID=UPI0024352A6F|nr:hypothetical protein [Lysinibacter sp. HNR]WGD38540.1 hypothetical protein FrondiHNR_06445 [Lysinibacter sp. HNR]